MATTFQTRIESRENKKEKKSPGTERTGRKCKFSQRKSGEWQEKISSSSANLWHFIQKQVTGTRTVSVPRRPRFLLCVRKEGGFFSPPCQKASAKSSRVFDTEKPPLAFSLRGVRSLCAGNNARRGGWGSEKGRERRLLEK